MMATKTKRENCEGCCKQIYMHNKVIICHKCNKISHHACATATFNYDQIKDIWTCSNCITNVSKRYNTFDSVFYNKYSITKDGDEPDEISKIKHILDSCQVLNLNNLHNFISTTEQRPISILFNNIDGFTSNFDAFLTNLCKFKSRPSIISFAETNINEMHKNLFKIPGYDSEVQSKIGDKHKGSGLAIYLDENLIKNKIKECCISTHDIESLFVTIENTAKPVTFGHRHDFVAVNFAKYRDIATNFLLNIAIYRGNYK